MPLWWLSNMPAVEGLQHSSPTRYVRPIRAVTRRWRHRQCQIVRGMNSYYKLRYHLARGRNYKKWQLKHMSPVGKFALDTFYRNPDDFVALLHNCRLRNHGSVAKKIHDGMNKTVCAWIEFNDFPRDNWQPYPQDTVVADRQQVYLQPTQSSQLDKRNL